VGPVAPIPPGRGPELEAVTGRQHQYHPNFLLFVRRLRIPPTTTTQWQGSWRLTLNQTARKILANLVSILSLGFGFGFRLG
jgi:hypothetical protein